METKELVAKIHNDFHIAISTADEKLAEMLNLIVIEDGERVQTLREYANLKDFFGAAEEVTKSLDDLKDIDRKKAQASKIELFRQELQFMKTLTGLKFIHYPAVISLCKKYNLVLCDSTLYNQTIPQNNLKELNNFISSFKDLVIKDHLNAFQDVCVKMGTYDTSFCDPVWRRSYKSRFWAATKYNNTPLFQQTFGEGSQRLYTIAPEKFFNTEGLVNIGNEMVNIPEVTLQSPVVETIPDPIVLAPMNFESELGKELRMFATVTAWGPEARDPLVFNEQLN